MKNFLNELVTMWLLVPMRHVSRLAVSLVTWCESTGGSADPSGQH
jgi:hypothetical protein